MGNWKNTAYELVGGGGSPTATIEIRNHNDVNQITRINTNGTPQPFNYDHGNNTDERKGNGNLANDGTRSYVYDALNRLIQVTRASDSAVIAAYTYDALNRRIRKVVTNGGITNSSALNGTTDYLLDGARVIEERDDSNNPVKQYVWGIYIDELIQLRMVSGSINYYLLSDLLYRTTALTDSSGNIAEAYDTDAYGNTLSFSAAGTGGNWFADNAPLTDNPICHYIFTGREYDTESLIHYYNTRHYESDFGRFLSKDSIGYIAGMNLYQYTTSNPVIKLDPSGQAAFPCSCRPSVNIVPRGFPLGITISLKGFVYNEIFIGKCLSNYGVARCWKFICIIHPCEYIKVWQYDGTRWVYLKYVDSCEIYSAYLSGNIESLF